MFCELFSILNFRLATSCKSFVKLFIRSPSQIFLVSLEPKEVIIMMCNVTNAKDKYLSQELQLGPKAVDLA